MEYIKLYLIMVVIYCYLEQENDKVLKKFYVNNSFYFEIPPSFKHQILKFQN